MKKIWQLWLTMGLAVLLLVACNTNTTKNGDSINEGDTIQVEEPNSEDNSDETEIEPSFPVTLTDAVGNEITIEQAPETIVSMIPSNTEILFALGLDKEIIGVGDWDDYPAEALEKEKIGGMEFNVEKIVAMNPDIVFAHASALGFGDEGFQQLRDAGITLFVVENANDFDQTYETIEVIGKATGKTAEAEQIIADMKAKVEEVKSKLANVSTKKTVFVETSPAPEIYTPGSKTFMQEILDMIGADNIAADQDGWVVMDPEEIVNRNPDVIVVMYDFIETAVEDVYVRDGYDTITAIKEKSVVQVNENLTSRTGPRLALGFEEMAKAIYPEVFGE